MRPDIFTDCDLQLSPQENAIAIRFNERPSRVEETHEDADGGSYFML